jgi:hypothetical protein
MYINRLIREDRDRQIDIISQGKEYSSVENEISNIENITVSDIYILLNYSIFVSRITVFLNSKDRYLAELNDLFATVDDRRMV